MMNRHLAPLTKPRRQTAAAPARRQAGATLLEAVAALFVASLMFMGLTLLVTDSMQNLRDQQAAQYQSQLASAAKQFLSTNYATLAASAAASQPVVVPLHASGSGALQLASFLPTSIAAQNVYGQTPCLLVFAPTTGGLDARLVTEGGQAISDPDLGYIAANAGTGAGSIPANKPGSGNTPNSAAYGAYGSWTIAAPNPSGAKCSGVATGAGHLVTEVFNNGPTNQNADFLYRVGVSGYADANAMHVPIYLADQTHSAGTSDSACGALVANSAGKITADATGNVLSCSSDGRWERAGSMYWLDPVATQADLPTGGDVVAGDVALALDTGIPYEYTGTSWHSLIVDNDGNLNIGSGTLAASQVALTSTHVVGASCDSGASLGGVNQLSVSAAGTLLSCQNGMWQDQSRAESGNGAAGCIVLVGPSPSPDYSYCAQYTGSYPNGTTLTASSDSFLHYTTTWTITLDRPGVITASTWAHMNDTYCKLTGYSGQLQQWVAFIDNDTGNVIGSNWSQSPTLNDTTSGITTNLITPLTPNQNGYNVELITSWVTYSGPSTPYAAALCDQWGNPSPVSAVSAGWTITSFY